MPQEKADYVILLKIHFQMYPPSVTVLMMDNDTEVGTEFDRLKPLKSWYCDMCTAENDDITANKCCFCNANRTYKEKISTKEAEQESIKIEETTSAEQEND